MLTELLATARTEARSLADVLRSEADRASAAGASGVGALQGAARAAAEAAEAARTAAETQAAEIARRLQELGEAAFEAGARADRATQARLDESRRLIETSSEAIEQTGARLIERFRAVTETCAREAEAVDAALQAVQDRLAAAPEDARSRVREIEAALSAGLLRLNDAGKAAFAEAANLDRAFQNRLRDSYAAMGELVARLGGLAGAPPTDRTAPMDVRAPGTRLGLAAAPPEEPEATLPPIAVREQPVADAPAPMAVVRATPVANPDASWREILSGVNDSARADQDMMLATATAVGAAPSETLGPAVTQRILKAGSRGPAARQRATRDAAGDAVAMLRAALARDVRLGAAAERWLASARRRLDDAAPDDEMVKLYLLIEAALTT
jgi:hypothetical protein